MERKRSKPKVSPELMAAFDVLLPGESRLQRYRHKKSDKLVKADPFLSGIMKRADSPYDKPEAVARVKSTGIVKGHFIERGDILVSDVLQYMLECFCDWEKFEECCSYREPQTHMIVHRRNGQRFMVKVEIIPRGKKYPRP